MARLAGAAWRSRLRGALALTVAVAVAWSCGGSDPTPADTVFRNGYVSIMVEVPRRKLEGLKEEVLLLHSGYHDPFFVLAEMLEQCWRITGFDAPYMVAAELFPATGAIFTNTGMWREHTQPYWQEDIVWPLYVRQPGEDPRVLARRQIMDLYHAFGLHPPQTIEPPKKAA